MHVRSVVRDTRHEVSAIKWAFIRVNFDPVQEIESKVGGGGGGGGGVAWVLFRL